MKKRGALELSINTIVIVVIGITLLTLALVFVRGIFGQLDSLTEDVFGTAQTQIGKLSQEDAALVIPSIVKINQGEIQTINIIVGNEGTTVTNNFAIQIIRRDPLEDPKSTVLAAKIIAARSEGTNTVSCLSFTLEEGETITIPMTIAATNDASITTGLSLPLIDVKVWSRGTPTRSEVNCQTNGVITGDIRDEYQAGTFQIQVEKGTGLFG